jgi:hypothetical protein
MGAQHTIVCAGRCSASHHSCQWAHIIVRTNECSDFFVAPTGTCQNIVCADGGISLSGLSLQSFSKHCTSHWVQNRSIAPPAIGRKLKASRHHPALKFSILSSSGTNYHHCTTIGCFFQALGCHLAPILSIAPPLGASFKHHRAFMRFLKPFTSRCCYASLRLCCVLPQVPGDLTRCIFLHRQIDVAGEPASHVFLCRCVAVATKRGSNLRIFCHSYIAREQVAYSCVSKSP